MKSLLAKLDVEGFVFDIEGELPPVLPQIEGAVLLASDLHTLELDMPLSLIHI